jgi:hypothetical protein
MKESCILVQRFNQPPPTLGIGFPASPYAFIVHFNESTQVFSDAEAQKLASEIVDNLLKIDRDNPRLAKCPNEYVTTISIDLGRLGAPLAISKGISREWAIATPCGSQIPRTTPKPKNHVGT